MKMKIVYIKTDELNFADYNPRSISENDFKQLQNSFNEFDVVEPIVVNSHKGRENVIVGGHQRTRVALSLNIKTLPCVIVDLPYEREKQLNIRLNRNAGEWDFEKLANEFEIGDLNDWGFVDSDFGLAFTVPPKEQRGTDSVPQLAKETKALNGDIWELGRHRVMCGDPTSPEHIERLTAGETMNTVFTDPLHSLGVYNKKKSGAAQEEEILEVSKDVFNMCVALKITNLFFWGANFYTEVLPGSPCWLIWSKKEGNSASFRNFSELCYTNLNGGVELFVMASEQTESRGGIKIKPVQLVRDIWERYKIEGNIIDLFGGAGTTLIAAEAAGHTSFIMENEPKYCDLIIRRYINYCEENGIVTEIKLNGSANEADTILNS